LLGEILARDTGRLSDAECTTKAGASPVERHADEDSTAGAGPAVHNPYLESTIKAERGVSAWIILEIVAGEAAGLRELDGTEIKPQ
jgi:hypothetical protein